MNKKLIFFLVLVVIATGGIFAQEKYDGSFKNTIFFGLGPVGYERALNQSFSAGAEIGYNPFAATLYVDVFARWYPWQRIFFANLGLGYMYMGGFLFEEGADSLGGFLIQPQAGWKIDIGNAGSWILEVKAGLGLLVGASDDEMILTIPISLCFGRTF